MERCIQLAKIAVGKVAPNPLVGAVIVHNNKIIGEGYHKNYGDNHAEVNAINNVENSSLLKESTIYVSLEPCSHKGKTPPCANLLCDINIKKVVIGCTDISLKVNGKGIEILRNKGIEVKVGVLEKKCRELNKHFFKFHEKKRPFILLKWAESSDGFIDKDGKRYNISGIETQTLVHKLRSEYQGIVVGRKTVENDNPNLTVRAYKGQNPTRIIIDPMLRLDDSLSIFNKEAKTIILNTKKEGLKNNIEWIKLSSINPKEIIKKIFKKNIQSIIIEGGQKTIQSFIENNLWDETIIIKSDTIIQKGTKAPILKHLHKAKEMTFFNDKLLIFRNV